MCTAQIYRLKKTKIKQFISADERNPLFRGSSFYKRLDQFVIQVNSLDVFERLIKSKQNTTKTLK